MNPLARLCCWSLVCLGTSVIASAQVTAIWTGGGGNSNWTTSANWDTAYPGTNADDIARFNSDVSSATANVNSNKTLGRLVFTGSSSGYAVSFTGSRTLTLGASGVGLDNQTDYTVVFANKFTLAADQTWQSVTSGSGFTFDGNVDLAGQHLALQLASSGSSTITFNGKLAGTGSNLTVSGNGTALLTGVGSYTGTTTINSGATLRTSGSGTLSLLTDVTVNAGGTLDFNGLNDSISTIAGAGNIALGAAALRTNGTASTTFSGVIADSGAGGSLDKRGSGTLTLSGANTFTGGVVLNVGAISVLHDSALGTGTLDFSGGTLTAPGGTSRTLANGVAMSGSSFIAAAAGTSFVFSSDTVVPSAGTLTLDNTDNAGTHLSVGFSGSGGSFAFARLIALDDAFTDLVFQNTSGVQEFSGRISGPGHLVRNASGGVTLLSAANTFTGTISLLAGTVRVSADTQLGATPGSPSAGLIIFDGGALNTTASFTLNSNRGIALQSGGGTFEPDSGTTLTYGGVIAGSGGFTQGGTGTLALTGANTFTGGVSIPRGTVSVASINSVAGGSASSHLGAPTTVADGTLHLGSGAETGTLVITSAALQISDRVIDLSGTTGGGIIEVNGAGGLALTGNLTATGAGAKTLTLQGAGTASAFGGAIVDGAGTTALTKDGTGTWTLNGASANTATGLTTINAGTLALAKTDSAAAISGNITVGDGAGTDTLRLNGSHQITDSATVTLASSGVFNLNGYTETIGGLSAASGSAQVQLGSGSLTVDHSSAQTFTGSITGSGALTKAGSGSLTLSGSSGSFSGPTVVTAGSVTVQSANALGTGAVTVSSGAALRIQAGLTVANALTLAGSGTASDGALQNISGSNTLNGAIGLTAATRIESTAGSLSVTGGITGSGHTVTFGGAGDISVTGIIATGGGGLVKEGSGVLRLGAAAGNSFAGATIITAGSIVTDAANQFNNSAALAIGVGATLSLNDFSQTIGSLAGSGTLDFGAGGTSLLTLSSGSATFSGSFAGAGTIIIGPGVTLTLGTNFNAPGINFTLAGGTLALNGTTSTFGSLHITGDSMLDFGNSVASVLTVNNVTFANTGLQLTITQWAMVSDYFYAQNFSGATPDVSGSTPQNQVSFTGFSSNSTAWQSIDQQIRPIPEVPSYGALFLVVTCALVLWRRRASAAPGDSPAVLRREHSKRHGQAAPFALADDFAVMSAPLGRPPARLSP